MSKINRLVLLDRSSDATNVCDEMRGNKVLEEREMIDVERALRSERVLRAVTGVSKKEYEQLLEVFAPLVERVFYKRNRRRLAGGGRKHTLRTPAWKLFLF